MTTTYTEKVLGQEAPAAGVETAVYTCPGLTSTVISSVTVCNRGAATTFRLAVVPNAAITANKHYQHYDVEIRANDSLLIVAGWTIDGSDALRCSSASGSCSFTAYGQEKEVTP